MSKELRENIEIKIHNIRCNWYRGNIPDDKGKYSVQLLFDPSDKRHAKILDEIKAAHDEVLTARFGKVIKYAHPLIRSHEADDEDVEKYPELLNMITVKATKSKRPDVRDRDKSPIDEDASIPYSGCYNNYIIAVYPADFADEKGVKIRRACATLLGVQFFNHGEKLGGGSRQLTDADFEEYEPLEDDLEPAAGAAKKWSKDTKGGFEEDEAEEDGAEEVEAEEEAPPVKKKPATKKRW